MSPKKKSIGKIIKPGNVNVWPHEEVTAKVLALAGYNVEFIPCGKRAGENSADAYLDGVKWEMKAPRAGSLKAVERNLKRGRWQSDKIIFDSRRMKGVPDKAIERELRKRFDEIDGINEIMFINRHGNIIDIRQ